MRLAQPATAEARASERGEEEVVGAVDDDDRGGGDHAAQCGEGIRRTVLIVAAGHEEDRAFDVEGGQRLPTGGGQGRRNQRQSGQAVGAGGHPGRHGRAEGVAGQGQGCGGRKPLPQEGQRGPDVVLLTPPLVPGPPGAPDPAKVEAKGGQALPLAGPGRRGDDRAVHVAPVPGVRVAEDDPTRGLFREGQGSLQGRTGCNGNSHGLFRYHPAERITVGGGSVQRLC